jgi:hypothetical protein
MSKGASRAALDLNQGHRDRVEFWAACARYQCLPGCPIANCPCRTNAVTSKSAELRSGWRVAPMVASCSSVSVILYLTVQLGPPIESARIRSSVPLYRPGGNVSPAFSLTSCGACKLMALVWGRAPCARLRRFTTMLNPRQILASALWQGVCFGPTRSGRAPGPP